MAIYDTIILPTMNVFEKGFRRVANVVTRRNDPKPAGLPGAESANIPSTAGSASGRGNELR